MSSDLPAPPAELLTVRQLAANWKLSVRQVYRLVEECGLPAVRLGRRSLRFSPPAVAAWLEERGA